MKTLIASIVLALPIIPAAGQGPEYRAFKATIRTQYWTESGSSTERSGTFTRSKDGSYAFVSEVEHPIDKEDPAKRGRFSELFNASRRLIIMTEPFTESAVATPISDEEEYARVAASYGTCDSLRDGSWNTVGRSTLLGFEVIEVEVGRTERSVIRQWVAPELQCFALKFTYVLDRQLRVLKEALSVESTEPPAGIFEPPAGYARVSPQELEDRYRAKFPGHEFYGKQLLRTEERYQRGIARTKK